MHTSQNQSFAILRILFGFVWLIDAAFKWTPGFLNNFTGYLTEGAQGQPALIQSWIQAWMNLVNVDPFVFAVIVAIIETALALALIFGYFTRPAIIVGTALTLVIWSTAEGFGGPYVSGSTDIGAGIIYTFVFIALWIGRSWSSYSLDARSGKHPLA